MIVNKIPWHQFKTNIKNYIYIDELHNFITKVIINEKPEQIVLFGSIANKVFDWNSDADLFILFNYPCHFQTAKNKLLRYTTLKDNMIHPFPYYINDFNNLAENPNLFIHKALKDSILIYQNSNY
ncbi:MAG: nucleotidyltransferase domain-containing protein [Spirochaetota bacterium]|nr:nucleotidyltransferase domain-containing protein [Spirochaetota bacterium]